MTRHVVITTTSSGQQQRRRLLPPKQPSSASCPTTRCRSPSPPASLPFAEAAGSAAADCTAICCCGPCMTIDLLVLAVVRVPVGLCRKALRKKALRRMDRRRERLLQSKINEDDEDKWVHTCPSGGTWPEKSPARAVSDMEDEMWATFSGTGFWRSLSRRDQ